MISRQTSCCLALDALNWDTPQTLVLSVGQDADLSNESAIFSLSTTGLETSYVQVKVLDDDFQTYVVDSLLNVVASDGLVTLREALEAANTNQTVSDAPEGSSSLTDVITFDPALFFWRSGIHFTWGESARYHG